MSRPFDDTSAWWREELIALVQISHQNHIHEKGTWRTCPMQSCARARAILDESKSPTETIDLHPENVVFVRVRKGEQVRGQKYITFGAEVNTFLTGQVQEEPIDMPLFRELDPEEEAAFRKHAREHYVLGDPIEEIYHPIWCDEARKMNEEAASPPGSAGSS